MTAKSPATPPPARRTEYVALSSLAPDPRNPKNHQTDVIDASIGRFGVIDPIVRDERTGFIISGHGRTKTLAAMRDRGETPPEGVAVDAATGEWMVPVAVGWASRTDSEAAAALIALNRTTELGGWVDDALLDLLDDLSSFEGGFEGVGFDEDDLADLRRHLDAIGDEDLGDLADDWDGTGTPSRDKGLLTLTLNDKGVAARWAAHRKEFDTDDEALNAVLPVEAETT